MMRQKKKNLLLIVISGILICASILLSVTGNHLNRPRNSIPQFSIEKTAAIDHITISSKGETVKLEKFEEGWVVNSNLQADRNLVQLLLAVLNDMKVARPVPGSQKETITERVRLNGFDVHFSGAEMGERSFLVAGNETKTQTYLMEDLEDDPVIMEIPGYDSYVAGIFELSSNEWRQRVILRSNWRTLKQLSVKYAQFPDYNFDIRFSDDFLKIENVQQLDTAKMMNYLEQLDGLQVDRYLEKGTKPQYDSLHRSPSTVSVSVEDINPENSKSIRFYPLIQNDPMMLAYIEEDDQLVLFEANRIQGLFAIRSEFEQTKEQVD